MIDTEKNLEGVHPDLVKLFRRGAEIAKADNDLDIGVIEGVRTMARQRRLLAAGATTTLKSRHLTGDAIDVVPIVDGVVRWDWPLYDLIAEAMDKAAAELSIAVEWGGRWRKFRDGPHWQRPWSSK